MKRPVTNRRDLVKSGGALLVAGLPSGCANSAGYDEAVRRTWRGATPLPSDRAAILRELVRLATLAPSGHNTQPWKFRLQSDVIEIHRDTSRRTPVVDPDDHHVWVSLGCATENLLQAGMSFGLRGGPTVTGDGLVVRLSAQPVQRTALFDAIPRRQSTRADYDGRPLRSDEMRQLESAGADPEVRLKLLTSGKELDMIRDFVIAGNSAQMADPAFVRELKQWIRFSKDEAVEKADGLFAGSSGATTAPRWLGSPMFSLFFEPKTENDKYARQLRSSAGVAVFAAGQANPEGWVAAGRACERFLLQAAALNVRTAFVNQPVEVIALRPQFASALGLGDRRPDLVVRFGHGPLLPPSLRRPVEAVLAGER
jgi:nitroreductase